MEPRKTRDRMGDKRQAVLGDYVIKRAGPPWLVGVSDRAGTRG